MRIWDGDRYYNMESPIDRNLLLQIRPDKVWYSDSVPTNKLHYERERVAVYQTSYNERTALKLDPNYIPYHTGGFLHNFENDVLIDVYKNRKEWLKSEYVGVLSWRFKQKTGIDGHDLVESVLSSGASVVAFTVPTSLQFPHPYTRHHFDVVSDMIKHIDKSNILPCKLEAVQVKQIVWCNYWVARPEIFIDYIKNWLVPCIECIRLTSLYDATITHRTPYTPAVTFFLEGLFSVYLTQNSITCKFLQ